MSSIEGETYGDGFLCENLGVNEATYDTMLAVDVQGKNAFGEEMPDNFFKTSNVLEMVERSVRILIYNQTRTNLSHLSHKSIMLLEPNTKEHKTIAGGVISKEASTIVLQHHERTDGSGYPKGLEGNEISIFGKIYSIVDSFDAMTTNRYYQPALSSFEAMKIIKKKRKRL